MLHRDIVLQEHDGALSNHEGVLLEDERCLANRDIVLLEHDGSLSNRHIVLPEDECCLPDCELLRSQDDRILIKDAEDLPSAVSLDVGTGPSFRGCGSVASCGRFFMRRRLWAGVAGMAFIACGSDPGYEPSHSGSTRRFVASEPRESAPSPEAPRETVEAMQSCADRLASSLSPGQHAILFDVVSTKGGKVAEVLVSDSMLGSGELEACLMAALKQMTVPASVTRPQKQGVTPDSRGMVGVVQAAAAPIALAPIALVVGGVAILAVVTVAVASGNVTVDEVLDAARRRRPKPTKNRCLNAAAGGQYMWYELCRAIAMTDPVKAEGCWALAEDGSEEKKRNWCNGVKF